jgi:hypothetical protein
MAAIICDKCKKEWTDFSNHCCPTCYPRWNRFYSNLLGAVICVINIAILAAIARFLGWL